jgi:CrcB protein
VSDVDRPPWSGLLAVVAVGGALGALARHALSVALPAEPGGLPVATLVTNLAGCLALGVLVGRRPGARWLRPFLGTGVLGGFTTVSAFALETDRLLADAPLLALAYVALSVGGGLALAAAGLRWGRS